MVDGENSLTNNKIVRLWKVNPSSIPMANGSFKMALFPSIAQNSSYLGLLRSKDHEVSIFKT